MIPVLKENIEDYIKKLKTNWKTLFLDEDNIKHYGINYDDISKIIFNGSVFPLPEYIFRAFNYFDIQDTRVVIIGQDPYHNRGSFGPYANGLSFGYHSEYTKATNSLLNIKKEIEYETGHTLTDITMESWAKQGVLMLNSSLTVLEGRPKSHKIWDNFMNLVIKSLEITCPDAVYLLMGESAGSISGKISETLSKNIIKVPHPSPANTGKKKFLGCNCFKMVELRLLQVELHSLGPIKFDN